MSFIAFSTAAPQVGEEQPLSSVVGSVSSWTTLDISAAFPPTKTPYSAKALIILGADIPSSGLLGKMRVRKYGETTSYEEAPGALGITSLVYRHNGEYQSGGFTAIVTVFVDTNGKFEYQFQNDSVAPRTMIRLLEVTTVAEIEDPIPLAQKGVANGVASLDSSVLVVEKPADATATPTADKIPIADGSGKLDAWITADDRLRLRPANATLPDTNAPAVAKVSGTNRWMLRLDFDQTTSEKAYWDFALGNKAAEAVRYHLCWSAAGGSVGDNVKWDIKATGIANDEPYKTGGDLDSVSVTDSLIAVNDHHVVTVDAGSVTPFNANHHVFIELSRDTGVANNLAADAQFLGGLAEFREA